MRAVYRPVTFFPHPFIQRWIHQAPFAKGSCLEYTEDNPMGSIAFFLLRPSSPRSFILFYSSFHRPPLVLLLLFFNIL